MGAAELAIGESFVLLTYGGSLAGSGLAVGEVPFVAGGQADIVVDPVAKTVSLQIVADVTPPVVICTDPGPAPTGTNCMAAIPTVAYVASDNASATGALTAVQAPPPGTLVGAGTHTITVTVADEAGNPGSCTATFVVPDETPAIVAFPVDRTVCVGQPASFSVQASGPSLSFAWTRSGAPVATGAPLTFSSVTAADAGTYVVTVTNGCGSAQASATLTVHPDPFPIIDCPPDVLVATDPGRRSARIDAGIAMATEFCSGEPLSVEARRRFEKARGHGDHLDDRDEDEDEDEKDDDDDEDDDDDAPGPRRFRLGTTVITWSATAGNRTVTCEQRVVVVDVEAPEIRSCEISSAQAGPDGTARVPSVKVHAKDNCTHTNDLALVQVPAAGTPVGVGTTTVTVTVADEAGNASPCTASFVVRPRPSRR